MRVLDMFSIRRRDWSGFPPELLEIIASKLKSYIDYVQFRAVCVKWRSSISSTTHHLPTQPPWLVFPYSSNIRTNGSFLDISTNQSHRLNLTESRDYRCCGSSQGWLVFIEQYTPAMFLMNPLTQNVIDLPPPVTSFKKVVLSLSPSNSDCIAFAIVNETRDLAFCKKGFEEWSFIEKTWSWYEDAIYYNGSFYAINEAGSVAICDLSGVSPIVTLIKVRAPRGPRVLGHGVYYLVDSFGELMLVIRSFQLIIREYDLWSDDDCDAFYETYDFSVYKFVSSKQEWVKMKTLGDHMLFLGGNSSVCLSTSSDFSGWKRNCIYFSSEDKNLVDGNHDFGVYRLNGGSILPLPYGHGSSRHMLPPPIWVTPNPC